MRVTLKISAFILLITLLSACASNKKNDDKINGLNTQIKYLKKNHRIELNCIKHVNRLTSLESDQEMLETFKTRIEGLIIIESFKPRGSVTKTDNYDQKSVYSIAQQQVSSIVKEINGKIQTNHRKIISLQESIKNDKCNELKDENSFEDGEDGMDESPQ